MRTVPPPVLPLFRSDLQARLLAALLLDSNDPLTARELIDRTGASSASTHRELGRLEAAGLIEHDRVGRTKRYRAATDSPLYEPLRTLLERTLGVAPMLRRALEDVEGIEAAAIFGSWAAGTPGTDSDIDLLVVGDVSREELLTAVGGVEQQTRREIDVTAYRRAEFDQRLEEGSGFLKTVLNGAKVPLIGVLG
jgi:predicted nucleotidyltransferase